MGEENVLPRSPTFSHVSLFTGDLLCRTPVLSHQNPKVGLFYGNCHMWASVKLKYAG